MPSLLGLLLGIAVGAFFVAVVVGAAASGQVPVLVAAAVVVGLLVFVAYLFFYARVAMALAGPLAGTIPNPGTPNPIVMQSELFDRAASAGLTAVLNAAALFGIFLAVSPWLATGLAAWPFLVGCLVAFPVFSMSRLFQGVVGWSGWFFPLSLMASVFGFVWFVVNAALSRVFSLPLSFRFDWTTGVIESAGGVTFGVAGAAAGTVGHFSFLLPGVAPTPFVPVPPTAADVSAHETGHSLDYVAFSGFRVIFALFDQVIFGNGIRAYSELTADSHVPRPGRFQVRLWS